MPKIYDFNGSAATQLKKIYDWNGSVATQLKKGYDHNGTTSSLIYQADTPITGWVNGGYANFGSGALTISGSVITFPANSWGSNFGAVAWSNRKFDITTSSKIQYYVSYMSFKTYATNIAQGAQHLGAIYVVFATSQININNTYGQAVTSLTEKGATTVIGPSCKTGYWPANSGDKVTKSTAAGTYTTQSPVSGNYYVGICLSGWDGELLSNLSVSNVTIL